MQTTISAIKPNARIENSKPIVKSKNIKTKNLYYWDDPIMYWDKPDIYWGRVTEDISVSVRIE